VQQDILAQLVHQVALSVLLERLVHLGLLAQLVHPVALSALLERLAFVVHRVQMA